MLRQEDEDEDRCVCFKADGTRCTRSIFNFDLSACKLHVDSARKQREHAKRVAEEEMERELQVRAGPSALRAEGPAVCFGPRPARTSPSAWAARAQPSGWSPFGLLIASRRPRSSFGPRCALPMRSPIAYSSPLADAPDIRLLRLNASASN